MSEVGGSRLNNNLRPVSHRALGIQPKKMRWEHGKSLMETRGAEGGKQS